MKKRFRVISVVLCCVLVFNLFGCTGKKEEGVVMYPSQGKDSTSEIVEEALIEDELIEEEDISVYASAQVTSVTDMEYTYMGKTGLYTGDWQGDRPEGKGCLYIDDNNYYDGEWICGYIHGQAEIKSVDENGVGLYCMGECSGDALVGEGSMYFATDVSKASYIEIWGDFSDENSLYYASFDDDEFPSDYGTVTNGNLVSFLELASLNDLSYMSPMTVRVYDGFEGEHYFTQDYEGYYIGGLDDDGKPDGGGLFVKECKIVNEDININGSKMNIPCVYSKMYLGMWENGIPKGDYLLYDGKRPQNNQYFDSAHTIIKKYYFVNENKLEKQKTYRDDPNVTQVVTSEIHDYELCSDGVNRAGKDKTEIYYKHDYNDGGFAISGGTYCLEETTPCFTDQYWYGKGTPSYYDDGYRAYYDANGNLYRCIQYDKDHINGVVTVGDKNSSGNVSQAILTAGGLLIGAFIVYKLVASSPSSADTYEATSYQEKKRTSTGEAYPGEAWQKQKAKAEEIREQARAKEDSINWGTYTEYEVNQIKKQARELYREADRIEPPLF